MWDWISWLLILPPLLLQEEGKYLSVDSVTVSQQSVYKFNSETEKIRHTVNMKNFLNT